VYAKLNPTGSARVNFPGFQEILDFTSAGGEASVSVTVDGDTDKEYKILIRSFEPGGYLIYRFNADTGANYGRQYLFNNGGTISAARGTGEAKMYCSVGFLTFSEILLSTPSGLVKTHYQICGKYTSGNTVNQSYLDGNVWNSTAKPTSITFSRDTDNFTAGTRITVYARRSNV
jgi:hypothetical protein